MKKSHLLKSVTVVTLLAILCMTLFGCAQPEGQTSTTTTTTPAAPSEPENNTELVDLLTERNLPELKTRDEMLEVMQREVYGYMPAAPEKIEFTEKRKEFMSRHRMKRVALGTVVRAYAEFGLSVF